MIIQLVLRSPYPLLLTHVLFITGVLMSTTLTDAATEVPTMLTPEQAAVARDQILNWLECVDCLDHELEKVARLGTTAVPSLIATLRQGPSEAQRESMRRRLITLFAQSKHSGGHKPGHGKTMSESSYVEHHLNGYSNRCRMRAAIALGRIGSPESKAALQAALHGNYPPSVSAVVMNLLKRMDSSTTMSDRGT